MFSVVMPLWNKRQTVAASVASVLAQSRRDFELIVVDDGSTDGSPDVLRGFADPRTRLIRQARAGPGAARNTGIAASRGAWIAFIDADDLWLPEHLDELVRIRRAFPEAGLIGARFLPRTNPCEALPATGAEGSVELIDYFRQASSPARPFCTSASAIPRSTYEELGGFGPAPWGQDAEYWARIALERPVAVSGRVTTIYRLASGGITDTVARQRRGPVRSIRDVGPSVALLVDRRARITCPDMRGAVDLYIEWRFRGCVRRCAMTGDVAALRGLRQVRQGALPLPERAILMLAGLPPVLARPACALGVGAARMARACAGSIRRLGGKMPAIAPQRVVEQPARQQALESARRCAQP